MAPCLCRHFFRRIWWLEETLTLFFGFELLDLLGTLGDPQVISKERSFQTGADRRGTLAMGIKGRSPSSKHFAP